MTVAVAVAGGVLSASPAWAASSGAARIAKPGTIAPLHGGGSQTLFAVALPVGSHCAGDTAQRGFRVWSYLVPKGTNLPSVSFDGLVPKPGFGFVTHGEFFGPVNTAQATGEILGLPNDFVLSRWSPSQLFAKGAATAVWEGGIACSDVHGRMSSYWNTEFAFTARQSDAGGFTWTVTAGRASPQRTTPWPEVLLLALFAVVIALWLSRRRWSRHEVRAA